MGASEILFLVERGMEEFATVRSKSDGRISDYSIAPAVLRRGYGRSTVAGRYFFLMTSHFPIALLIFRTASRLSAR
jgi:hypothetical protein